MTADAADEPAASSRERPRRLRLRLGLTSGLAALVAVLLVAAVVLGVLWQQERAQAAERDEVLDTAQRFTANFFTISAADFDAATARVLEDATGQFAGDYSGGLDALRSQLEESGSATEGAVLSKGLVSLDGDEAEALVVADSTVRRGEELATVNHYRVRLIMQQVDDDWRVSDVVFVQA